MPASDWPYVARRCYLQGGLTALNNPGARVEVSANVPGPVLAEFDILSFGSLYASLGEQGLRIFGCQFYQSADELEDLVPPEFRMYAGDHAWLAFEVHQGWRRVAVNALQQDRMSLADCAMRLAFGIHAVEFRILQLCKAYASHLRALALKDEIQTYRKFDDLNTEAAIHATHALFYELAVLRDCLAEFLGQQVFSLQGDAFGRCRTMTRLRKELVKLPLDDDLAKELVSITDRESRPPGWLAVLSAYRNLFTHVAPMKHVGLQTLCIQEMISISGGLALPIIYHPLPPDAIELQRSRSRGFPFKRFVEWARASAEHVPKRSEQPDALDYLHSVAQRILGLAWASLARSPIEPKPIEINPNDIIGFGATREA